MQYNLIVPLYQEIVNEVPLEEVSFQGGIFLILLVGIVIFRHKLSASNQSKKQEKRKQISCLF
jgi:hypothetical protein